MWRVQEVSWNNKQTNQYEIIKSLSLVNRPRISPTIAAFRFVRTTLSHTLSFTFSPTSLFNWHSKYSIENSFVIGLSNLIHLVSSPQLPSFFHQVPLKAVLLSLFSKLISEIFVMYKYYIIQSNMLLISILQILFMCFY